MRCFYCAIALLFLLLSCTRSQAVVEEAATAETVSVVPLPPPAPAAPVVPAVLPMAILQAGEFPLWFQFTEGGPVLIEAIEDACFSAALVPWPLAPHVRFMLAQGGDLLIAVNRDGMICLSPREGSHAALYRFSGGEFWQRYTVGALVLFNNKPVSLLYRDDRFLDSGVPLPSPRLWTFDLLTAGLYSVSLPSIDAFPPEEGWDVDSLRRGSNDQWYFRATKKTGVQPEIRMFRSDDLVREGEQVSLGAFQNSALPEPLSAAPGPLRDMLSAAFVESGCGLAAVVSPDFQTVRSFAADREKAVLLGFYSGSPAGSGSAFLLATTPQGNALYAESGAASAFTRRFSLPPLPADFHYTGIGLCGDTIFASWEEQVEYSIGAAGFMVIRAEGFNTPPL